MNGATGTIEAYLAEYRNRRAPAGDGDPSWAEPIRRRALDDLAERGLPSRRDEAWRQTDVGPLVGTSFPRAVAVGADGVDGGVVERLSIGEAAAELVFVNGRFFAERSRRNGLPGGVELGDLAGRPARGAGDFAGEHFGKQARLNGGGFAALNTAFFAGGPSLRIGERVDAGRPIHVLHLVLPGERPAAVYPRTLIVVEGGARAEILETYASLRPGEYLTNAVTEIVVGEGASVVHTKLQLEAPGAYHVALLRARQEAGSRLRSLSLAFGGAIARTESEVVLAGEEARCDLDGLTLGTGRQLIDHHTTIDHAAPLCESREVYKGILAERARSVFCGRIIVRPGAQKTDAGQVNQTLLLSGEARTHTKPQLEIRADDVRCTHGATVGRLDEEALFYLRSRGIDAETAGAMLIRGFARELVERVDFGPLRERVEEILAVRLSSGETNGGEQ